MSDDRMKKVDVSKLKPSEIEYIKLFEKQNLARVEKLQRLRKSNVRTGYLCGVAALSIYFYSMYAVKQERFLDDLEEPEKIIDLQK